MTMVLFSELSESACAIPTSTANFTMKFTGLLLTLSIFCARLKDGYTKSTTQDAMDKELLERAALQLERLSAFRMMMSKPHQKPVSLQPGEDNGYPGFWTGTQNAEDMIEVEKRFDELRTTASQLLHEPRYQAMMQDRIKRSFISGIANKLVGGVVGVASGASRGIAGLSSSNTPSDNGPYGHSYQTKFDIGDFAKAIINTVFQAIKAITGGAIAGGGALVKGGGYLVSAKGQIISSAGNAISTLGKSIASSAIIASPKPVYGHPGYSYNSHSLAAPNHDLTYDGPPPSADAYAGPEDAYNAGHSSYAAPSNDGGADDEAGVLIVKEMEPGHGHENHPPSSSIHESDPNLSAPEVSFGGASNGPSSIVTKITGILNSGQLPISDQDHREEHFDYYPEHHNQQSPSSVSTYESGFQSNHDEGNSDNTNYQTEGQIYDSYGNKIQPSTAQFASSHIKGYQLNQDHQPQLLTTLNTHLKVPKPQATDLKDMSTFADYQYHSNKHHSEPLKIPIFTSHQNSLDHSYDNRIEPLKYYGSPNYASTNALEHSSIGLDADTSQLAFSDYNNYRVPNAGFDQQMQYQSSMVGKPTILGVWSRISRRTHNYPVKKTPMINKRRGIHRSIGYFQDINW